MKHFALLAFAALALAACASRPIGTMTPSGEARAPEGRIELGDWARGSQNGVARRFSETIAARYRPGLPLATATADLRANQFNCAAPRERRGDPPDFVCRRTIQGAGCVNTWQVYLFSDEGAGLSRTRALFDKSCSRDELLGGPG